MGKKDGNKKRKAEDVNSDNEIDNDELEAEMAAVMAAREEKQRAASSSSTGQDHVNKITMYNKDGMLKCIEDMDVGHSFTESMVVCDFAANVVNENEDIEREVNTYVWSVLFLSMKCSISAIFYHQYALLDFVL
jgi:hypothetical protein